MSGSRRVTATMSGQDWALLAALSVPWGGSCFFNGVAGRELPTLVEVVGRVTAAALILHAVLRLTGVRRQYDCRLWAAFAVMGVLNNAIPFSLIVWGQAHIASGVASILNATTPLFTVIVAHVLTTDEKLSVGRLAGVMLGLAGVAVLVGGDAVSVLGGHLAA